MRNRFKGLDLIDGVPDELWEEVHDIVQKTRIKTIPMEKKSKKAVSFILRNNFLKVKAEKYSSYFWITTYRGKYNQELPYYVRPG